MSQRLGQLVAELVLGLLDLGQELLVLGEEHVRVVALFIRRVRVLEVQVVDGPVVAVAGGLGLLGLLA